MTTIYSPLLKAIFENRLLFRRSLSRYPNTECSQSSRLSLRGGQVALLLVARPVILLVFLAATKKSETSVDFVMQYLRIK